MQQRVANIEPINERAQLSEIAADVIDLIKQREELSEQIRAKYQEAADLGAPKVGFKLAVRLSRMPQEKLEEMQRGYKAGADALNLQMDLFGG